MSTQENEQQHTQSDTITETPEASQMSGPKGVDDESLLDPFAPSKHFPQKIRSPPQNPITDHNFKKKKNFLVYHNIVTCFQLKKCIYSDAYIVACPDMCQPCKYVLQFLFYFKLAKVVKHKNTCTTM